MNYFDVVKKAFKITFKYKFLWILGILAVFTEGGTANLNFGSYNQADWSRIQNQIQEQDSSSSITPSLSSLHSKVLGEKTSIDIFQQISNWISQNYMLVLAFIILILLIFIVIYVVSTIARASLISAVKKINDGKETTFTASFENGSKYFWKVLGLDILISILAFGFILVFLLPALVSLIFQLYAFSIVWVALLILPFIVFLIILSIIRQYSMRYVVLAGKGVVDSFYMAYKLLRTKFKDVAVFWLISIVLGIASSIAIGLAIFVIILVLVIIGLPIYFLLASGLWIWITFGAVVLIAAALLASGIIQSFISTYWTLSFDKLHD